MSEAALTLRDMVTAQRWTEIIHLLAETAPEEAPLYVAIAGYKACTHLGRPDAELWLDRAVALSPANASLHRAKGVFHLKRTEWSQACARFAEAARLRPEVASYYASLSYAQDKLDERAGAAESLRQALALDGSNRVWWLRLARILMQLDILDGAVEAYGSALALQEDPVIRSARDELLRQIRSGSRSASAAYYDDVFAESPKYQGSGLESSYTVVWKEVVRVLRTSAARNLLDLGCGPGQFAEFLTAEMPDASYTGVDFSEVAVASARMRCPQHVFEKLELPIADFSRLPSFDAVICTEVLEHVEHDCQVLEGVPAGVCIVATVPNFDSFGHLRVFRAEAEIRKRYAHLFTSLQIQPISLSEKNTLWLLHGRRSIQQSAWPAAAV